MQTTCSAVASDDLSQRDGRTAFTNDEDLHVSVHPLRPDLRHPSERRADVPHLQTGAKSSRKVLSSFHVCHR